MSIVFAENFKHDTIETLPIRFPGSVVGTATGATPTLSNAWSLSGNSRLFLPIPEFSLQNNNRMEVVINFADSTSGGSQFNIEFLGIVYYAATVLTNFGGVPGTTPSKSLRRLHLIVDVFGIYSMLTVYMDGVQKCPPTAIEWTPSNVIQYKHDSAAWSSVFPPYIDSIVVAYDTPRKTKLTDSPEWAALPLTITASDGWSYSDTGIVADLDKTDPKAWEPSVVTTQRLPLLATLGSADYSVLYGASRSESDELTVNSVPITMQTGENRVMPRIVNPTSVTVQPTIPHTTFALPDLSGPEGSSYIPDKAGNGWFRTSTTSTYGTVKLASVGEYGGRCLQFGPGNGTDYLILQDNSLIRTWNAWTLETSFKCTLNSTAISYLFFKAPNQTTGGLHVRISGSTLGVSLDLMNTGGNLSRGITLNTWIKFAMTFDPATNAIQVYLDGTRVHSSTMTPQATINNSAYPFTIGNRITDANYVLMDNVRISRGVLYNSASYTPATGPFTL